jgi:hypothetical protein
VTGSASHDANRLKSDGISDIIAKDIIGIKRVDKEKSAKRLRTIDHRFFTVTGTSFHGDRHEFSVFVGIMEM